MLDDATDSFRAFLEKATQNRVEPSPGPLLAAGVLEKKSMSLQRSLEASSSITKP